MKQDVEKVKVGDFVRDKDTGLCGIVLRIGSVPFGKKRLPVAILGVGVKREEIAALEDLILVIKKKT